MTPTERDMTLILVALWTVRSKQQHCASIRVTTNALPFNTLLTANRFDHLFSETLHLFELRTALQ